MRNNSMYKKMAKPIKTKKDALVAVCGALIILLLLDLSPLGGNIFFYAKWAQCGSRPIATSMGPGLGFGAVGVPYYYVDAKNFGFLRNLTSHFCTAKDAEQAGYSADSKNYEFPHLPASEFQQAIKKSQNL